MLFREAKLVLGRTGLPKGEVSSALRCQKDWIWRFIRAYLFCNFLRSHVVSLLKDRSCQMVHDVSAYYIFDSYAIYERMENGR